MPRRTSKYKAQPTVVDGIRFASKKEAKRYRELVLLERAGHIKNVGLQPHYRLMVQPDESDAADPVILGHYIADFIYWDNRGGYEVVEDVKGFKTPLYRWKKKHVEAQYGITISEV